MSIRSMAQSKASQVIKEHRDSAEAVTLRQSTTQRSTQDGGTTRSNTEYSFNALIEDYRRGEVSGSGGAIQPTDARCRCAAKDVGLDVEIKPQDVIVRPSGEVCTVVSATIDLHRSIWVLQLRRP